MVSHKNVFQIFNRFSSVEIAGKALSVEKNCKGNTNLGQTRSLDKSRISGQVKKADVSDTSDIEDFFSTFTNPTFRFSPIVKYENLDYNKSKIRVFDIRL